MVGRQKAAVLGAQKRGLVKKRGAGETARLKEEVALETVSRKKAVSKASGKRPGTGGRVGVKKTAVKKKAEAGAEVCAEAEDAVEGKLAKRTVGKKAPLSRGKKAGADAAVVPRMRRRKRVQGAEAIRLIEATLVELVRDGTSDAARVSAAKALMDIFKYMKASEDPAARAEQERLRRVALAEAERWLEVYSERHVGEAASAGSVGLEQPHGVVADGAG